MRRLLLLVALALCLPILPSVEASAAELRWRWAKGDVHRFDVTSTQKIRLRTMGAKVDAVTLVSARYALRVDAVDADGAARATLMIERFSVRGQRGERVARIDKLPANALRTPVHIDTKGRFRFERLVWLLVGQGGETMMVGGAVGPDGASAAASAGGEEVTLHARFDRKTGRLLAGYTVKAIGRKTTRIKVSEDARRVDLIPAQFLALLRLPDGDLAKGDKVEARVGDWQFDTTVEGLDAKRGAAVRVRISTPGDGTGTRSPGAKVKARTAAGAADVEAPAMPGMPAGMGVPAGMGPPAGMLPPGMGGPAGGEASDQPALPTLKMRGSVLMRHDVARGVMRDVMGSIVTEQRIPMPGMPTGEIDTTTDLELVYVGK